MKKVLALLLALLMIASAAMLASCSEKKDETPTGEEQTAAQQSGGKNSEPAKTETGADGKTPGENTGDKPGDDVTTDDGKQTVDPTVVPTDPTDPTEPPLPTVTDGGDTTVPEPQYDPESLKSSVVQGVGGLIDAAYRVKDTTVPAIDDFGVDAELKVTFSEELTSLLSQMLADPQTGEPTVDLSFLKELAVKGSADKNADIIALACSLLLNGKEIFGADVMADIANMEAVAKIPLLSDDYIEIPVEQLIALLQQALSGQGVVAPADEDYDYGYGYDEDYDYDYDDGAYPESGNSKFNFEEILALLSQIAEVMPDEETAKALANKYLTIALDVLAEQQIGQVYVQIGDVSKELTVVAVTLTPEKIIATAKALLLAAKDDQDVLKIARDVGAVLGVENADEAAVAYINDALDKLGSAGTQTAEGPSVVLRLYYDGASFSGLEVGAEISADEYYAFSAISMEKGAERAFWLTVSAGSESYSVVFNGVKNNGVVNGTVALTVNGEKLIALTIKDFDTEALKSGKFVGKISLDVKELLLLVRQNTPEEEAGSIDQVIALIDMMNGMSLYVEGKDEENKICRKVALAVPAMDLLTVELTFVKRAAAVIMPFPGAVSAEEVMESAVPDLILDKLATKLLNAGVPEEYVVMLGDLIRRMTAKGEVDPAIVGEWAQPDGAVVYYFNEYGEGYMIDDVRWIDFTYTADGTTLTIDMPGGSQTLYYAVEDGTLTWWEMGEFDSTPLVLLFVEPEPDYAD